MYELIKKLYPICRSITGNGVRETLAVIKKEIPIDIHEVPTGTKVFDWTIPKEWNIKDAYVKNSKGEKVIDFKNSNLHVLNYSVPVNKKMTLGELKDHLYTLPNYPDWIPYLTTYYNENWGFCMAHNEYEKLGEDTYEVFIDSWLGNGHLTYGELYIPGESEEEFLFSTYICHPSLCNDNLSGIALLTSLAKYLREQKRKYSYRFLFSPETIGAITWLCINKNKVNRIKFGLLATCVGDRGSITYKKSRLGANLIDGVVANVLSGSQEEYNIVDFIPPGSDERQFGSPGFNLPMGTITRTPYGRFPQHHTSADNLDFISEDRLSDTFEKCKKVIYIIENNETYLNLNLMCEPQLGKRGLYRMIGGQKGHEGREEETAVLCVSNLSDGKNSLLDISARSGVRFEQIKRMADALLSVGLLKKI